MRTGQFLFCLIWVSILALTTPRLFSQNASPYRTIHTLTLQSVRDTVSGIGVSVNEVMPRAKHGDVRIRLLSSGNLNTPNLYEIEYLPDAGFTGADTFVIERRSPASYPYLTYHGYRITVENSLLQPQQDYALSEDGSPVVVSPLLNDFSTAGGLEIRSIPLINHGTAVILNGTEILFSPEPGYTGSGHLNYSVCDAVGNCRTGSVSIGIGGAVPDCESLKIHVKRNEVHSFPLSFSCDTFRTASHGTLQIENGHILRYRPDPGFVGTDNCVLFYRKNGYFCSKSVDFRVIDPGTPNAMAMDDRVFTPVGMPVTFNVRKNDIGNLLVRGWIVPADFPGVLTNKTSGGQVTFIPGAGFTGIATFQYRIGSPSASSLETATVSIVVDNMAPSGRYTHKLTSPAGIPLVIHYDIPFQDFSFGIVNSASHGLVQYFPGITTQIIDGEPVTGNNLVVYEPDQGYCGSDKFSLLYCAPNGQCQIAKMEVELTAATDPSACFEECVWPGDINNDGAINSRDLLPLGLLTGRVGEPRSDGNTDWMGHYSLPWPSNLVETGFNHKHADANGDGEIGAPDADFLRVDGQRSRNLIPPFIPDIKGLPFYMKMLTPAPQLGKPMKIEVGLGSITNTVVDLYGFNFEFALGPGLRDSAFQMHFYDNSWINTDAPSLNLARKAAQGRFEMAFTRTNGEPVSGYGPIGVMELVIIDIIDGGDQDSRRGFNETPVVSLNAGLQTVDRIELPVPTERTAQAGHYDPEVWPTPASHTLFVQNINQPETALLSLTDLYGREVFRYSNWDGSQLAVPVDEFISGIYQLNIRSEHFISQQCVIIAH
jgi:hypothetical protein